MFRLFKSSLLKYFYLLCEWTKVCLESISGLLNFISHYQSNLSINLSTSTFLRLYQIGCIMHIHEKLNFLNICFDPNRGLTLNWNFNDITSSEHYFRHVFILLSQKQNQSLKVLLSLYKKMKSGDLFCCIYADENHSFKVGRWTEKSQLTSFNPQRYLKLIARCSLDKSLKLAMIEGAAKEILQFQEPVIANFLGVEKEDVEFYKNEIMRHRTALNSSYQYIVNLFGDFEKNSISVHTGFNLFQTNIPKLDEIAQYYHKMINSATVQYAKIDIISLDGEITLFSELYWKNTDFNRISATYYGPSSLFDFQKIYFFNRIHYSQHEYQFEVRLKIKLFQNKMLQNVKKVKINFTQEKNYCPTFHNVSQQLYYQNNIFLSENPNQCEMIVKFKPNKQDYHKTTGSS